VKGHTEKLKAMIAHKIKNPTFEDVFMEFTGVSFDEAEYEEAESA